LDKQTLVERNYYGTSRIPDIILETSAPRVFARGNKGVYQGTHGYANTDDMAATFVAYGPAFKSGVKINEMDNLEVYPIISEILGLKLMGDVDSKGNILRQALK
jgi:hypothetical protein